MERFLRPMTKELLRRLAEPPGLPQIVVGPRQVGKTTAIGQVIAALRRKGFAAVSVNADALASPPKEWVVRHWREADALAKTGKPVILALDELQKIPGWSDIVKREFDASQRLQPKRRPRVVISGSSALLVSKGMTESMAGRFEVIRFPHWSLDEESRAFGTDMEAYISLGGYPKRREFLPDVGRFLGYVRDSIIESVLNRDLLLLHPVDKPVLLRRLFEFACHHPAEMVSLQKMLGQLTDKGNVTTIAHYLDLLAAAFLIKPLQKYSPKILRIRASSPKLVVMAQALVAAVQEKKPAELLKDPALRGRWVENAVGSHLIRSGLDVFYWRDRDQEIDFIARRGTTSMAVEVSTSAKKHEPESLARLARRIGVPKSLVVGPKGVSLAEFLKTDPTIWLAGSGSSPEPSGTA
ncbi:MAG: ATP-binding protein [Elusimicrobia bacterium]|nr:ATP-binding protein [Elusimicrobiota bacterium]